MIELLQFCSTEKQRELIMAIDEHGSPTKAARVLGVDQANARKMYRRIKEKAAKQHYAPEENLNNPLPDGLESRGVSQLIDERTGKPVLTWYKSRTKAENHLENLIKAMDDYSPKPFPKIKAPSKKPKSELLDLIHITDYHFGMLAWDKEAGSDWDLTIAENVFCQSITQMIEKSQSNAESVIFSLGGDICHYDSLEAITPSSGHVLDSDSRSSKMVEVVMTCVDWAIQKLAEHYKKVRVIVAEGNHDLYGSIWMRKHVKAMFKKNPRVCVDDTEIPYYAYLHGRTMLAFHHGHKKAIKNLAGVFMGEPRYREMWGKATYTYIHTGHYHHREQVVTEVDGCITERHPTLASNDAYAVRGGYISKRGAYVITYHTELGEVSRSSVYPSKEYL